MRGQEHVQHAALQEGQDFLRVLPVDLPGVGHQRLRVHLYRAHGVDLGTLAYEGGGVVVEVPPGHRPAHSGAGGGALGPRTGAGRVGDLGPHAHVALRAHVGGWRHRGGGLVDRFGEGHRARGVELAFLDAGEHELGDAVRLARTELAGGPQNTAHHVALHARLQVGDLGRQRAGVAQGGGVGVGGFLDVGLGRHGGVATERARVAAQGGGGGRGGVAQGQRQPHAAAAGVGRNGFGVDQRLGLRVHQHAAAAELGPAAHFGLGHDVGVGAHKGRVDGLVDRVDGGRDVDVGAGAGLHLQGMGRRELTGAAHLGVGFGGGFAPGGRKHKQPGKGGLGGRLGFAAHRQGVGCRQLRGAGHRGRGLGLRQGDQRNRVEVEQAVIELLDQGTRGVGGPAGVVQLLGRAQHVVDQRGAGGGKDVHRVAADLAGHAAAVAHRRAGGCRLFEAGACTGAAAHLHLATALDHGARQRGGGRGLGGGGQEGATGCIDRVLQFQVELALGVGQTHGGWVGGIDQQFHHRRGLGRRPQHHVATHDQRFGGGEGGLGVARGAQRVQGGGFHRHVAASTPAVGVGQQAAALVQGDGGRAQRQVARITLRRRGEVVVRGHVGQVAGGDGDVVAHRDAVVGNQREVRAIGVLVGGHHLDVVGVDQHRTTLALGGTRLQSPALQPHGSACRELHVPAVARHLSAAGRQLGASSQRGRVLRHDVDGTTVRLNALSIGRDARAGIDVHVAARLDGHAPSGLAACTIGRDCARHRHVLSGDDADGVAVLPQLSGFVQSFQVDQGTKAQPRGRTRLHARTRIHHHLVGSQLHSPGCMDRALDADQAAVGQAVAPRQGLRHGRVVHRAGGADQAVQRAGCGRHQRQAAHIELALRAHHQAVRVEKVDVASDATVFVGVEHAVKHAALVAHQIEQVGGVGRELQVHRLAGGDVEARKGVERIVATHRCGGDVADRPLGVDAGQRASIGHDVGCGLHSRAGHDTHRRQGRPSRAGLQQ